MRAGKRFCFDVRYYGVAEESGQSETQEVKEDEERGHEIVSILV